MFAVAVLDLVEEGPHVSAYVFRCIGIGQHLLRMSACCRIVQSAIICEREFQPHAAGARVLAEYSFVC